MYVLFAALPIFISTMNKLSKYTPASKRVGGCGASIALLTTLFVCVCLCVCVVELLFLLFYAHALPRMRDSVERKESQQHCVWWGARWESPSFFHPLPFWFLSSCKGDLSHATAASGFGFVITATISLPTESRFYRATYHTQPTAPSLTIHRHPLPSSATNSLQPLRQPVLSFCLPCLARARVSWPKTGLNYINANM